MALLIVIGGPTASGKTRLGIELAQYFQTVILSADSRQFYQEMQIGNARPSPAELAAVPHYFIADRSIQTPLTAGTYASETLQLLEKLFEQHSVIILVGGSGLYIDAVCKGLDEFPTVPLSIKQKVDQLFKSAGLRGLNQALALADPAYHAEVDQLNPRRLQRALEVSWAAGKPYSSFKKPAQPRPFTSLYIQPKLQRTQDFTGSKAAQQQQSQSSTKAKSKSLDPTREWLYNRINLRVDQMMSNGLEAEAKRLYDFRNLPVLQTVGYQEFWPYFSGDYDLDRAVELIKRNSRRYAKRQITWFNRHEQYQAVSDLAAVLSLLPKP